MDDWLTPLAEHARRALRPIDGKLEAVGLHSEVEVLTDTWGVPHVFASSLDDLYFAQGYLHAAERLWQVELTTRLAQGRLSEILGELTLPLDRFFRTLLIGRKAREFVGRMDDTTRRILGPYDRGFRAGAEAFPRPVEYEILQVDPEIPRSFEEAGLSAFSIAMLMAFTLSANWELELLRYRIAQVAGPNVARRLTPFVGAEPPSVVPASKEFAGIVRDLTDLASRAGRAAGIGSNNWVVSGDKSTTGKPLLANDPHLKIQTPAIWMEMHLSSPEMNVAGVSLPGVPGVILGHNEGIAWGFTNTGADNEDLYLERLSEDAGSYLFRGEWHPVEVISEEIQVRNEPDSRIHDVRVTRHGPLITSVMQGTVNTVVKENVVGDAMAFRWVHHDVVPSLAPIEDMNRATGWDEFREAVRKWPSPGQNMVYADVDGNIGYQFTGQVPVRPPGVSGTVPLPGWTGEHEWQGTIPFDDLPTAFNPDCGYIATANNRMVDLDYPHYVTHDWEPNFRIKRIVELLTAREKHSAEDFARIQMDTNSGIAADLLPLLLRQANGGDQPTSAALQRLQEWDLQMTPGSVGASIFAVWVTKIADALFKEKLGEELYDSYFRVRGWTTLWAYECMREVMENPEQFWVGGDGADNQAALRSLAIEALESALGELESRFGKNPDEWRWGRLHQIHFRHPIATALPALDELLSIGPFEAPGADDTVNRGVFNPGEDYSVGAISSYRQIIDLADFDRSMAVITTGNSGNPASPHYRDQAGMWLEGRYHEMPFSRPAVEESCIGTLRLLPAQK